MLAAMTDRHRTAIAGDTDSEHVFRLILTLHDEQPHRPIVETLRIGVRRVLDWCAEAAPGVGIGLNLILTDGDTVVGTRWGRTLHTLTREGVSLTLFSLDDNAPVMPSTQTDTRAPDALEWQLPGRVLPPEDRFTVWVQVCTKLNLTTILAPVIPGSAQVGKQHPRTRIGYSTAGLAELNAWLREREHTVDRVVIDLGFDASPWETWTTLATQREPNDPAWDLKLVFESTDDEGNCRALAEA